jgi:hypothetical protein
MSTVEWCDECDTHHPAGEHVTPQSVEQDQQWGVAHNVAADGFVNPGRVDHAAHQQDAERKASLFGGVAVVRTVTPWKPVSPPGQSGDDQ